LPVENCGGASPYWGAVGSGEGSKSGGLRRDGGGDQVIGSRIR